MDTINPHDHAAWAAVDKYLEAQPLNYQDLDIDWSTAQYVDGQLQVNAIVGLVVPEHVLRKPQEYMDELKELRGRVLALSKENHQLKSQLKTREGDAHRLVDENHQLRSHRDAAEHRAKSAQQLNADLAQEKFALTKELETAKVERAAYLLRNEEMHKELSNKDHAIEVLKETQGSLIKEIAAQRDKALWEKQDLQEKLDRELARSRLIQAALENTNPEGD